MDSVRCHTQSTPFFKGLMPQNFAAHCVRPDDSHQRADEDCVEIEYFDTRLGRLF